MNCKKSKKGILILLIAFFLLTALAMPAMAAGELAITRSISDTEVSAGDTVRVTLVLTANQYIEAPVITEDGLPSGWVLTEVSDDSASFKNKSKEWFWMGNMDSGDQKNVEYDLTVPVGIADGTYDLSGHANAFEIPDMTTTGDTQITVGPGSGNPTAVTADFTANDTSGYAPLTVKFTDKSTAATSWQWDFDGDGSVDSTEQSPVYTYNETGTYSVKLAAYGIDGEDVLTKTNYIKVTEEGSYNSAGATSVSLSATIIPAISLEVTPGAIDFGALSAGEISDEHTLNIKNKGATDATVTAEVTDVARGLYEEGLKLDSDNWGDYYNVVDSGTMETSQVSLHVPSDYIGIGSMEGKLVFWAEMG